MNRLLKLPTKILYRLFKHGPVDVYWWTKNHLETRRRERKFGIATDAFIQPEELGYAADATGYDPISYASMDAILDDIHVDSDQVVFVDIGSGLGRAVIMAATRPFKRVIGIELNEELYLASLQFLERAKPNLTCQNVILEQADATQYDFPEDTTVMFIWNSFLGEILATVLERIRQHQLRSGRPLTLFYSIPYADNDTLNGIPWLQNRREIKTRFWTGIRVFRYTVNDARASS